MATITLNSGVLLHGSESVEPHTNTAGGWRSDLRGCDEARHRGVGVGECIHRHLDWTHLTLPVDQRHVDSRTGHKSQGKQEDAGNRAHSSRPVWQPDRS